MRSVRKMTMPVCVATILTIMRKYGVVETIDSRCEFDREQRILTPGEVVLLLIGATMIKNDRIPLYRIRDFYASMNIRGILGRDIDPESLNDHALTRGLDTLYKADRDQILWDISQVIEDSFGLAAKIFHVDQTKVRTFVIAPPECDPNAAKPEFGLDKEGRTDFMLYSANSITDEFRIIRYLSPDDGNASDPSMDMDAIRFLIDNIEPSKSTVVIDSKGANTNLITEMVNADLGFVTKVPMNFSSCLKRRIAQIIFNEDWCRSDTKHGYSFRDFDMMVDGETLETGGKSPRRIFRVVAFRSEKMLSDRRASLERACLKKAEKLAKELRKMRFDAKEDAMLAVGQIQERLNDNAYSLKWCLFPELVQVKREKRGRPKAGEYIEYTRQWKILCKPVIDEQKLTVLTDLDSVEVLITNLPRLKKKVEVNDPRDGASAEDVLDLYQDQYKQEHTFRLLKGKVGMGDVFFQRPERENAMMFVLGLSALMRNVVDHMFRINPGRFTTCQDMIASWVLLRVRVVDDELELDGPDGCEQDMLEVLERLGLDEGIMVRSISMSEA